MKKLLFVNSDMKVGGVQKSLCNLLWEISGQYDVTLLLFSPQGAYLKQLPPDVKVISPGLPWELLGTSQGQYKKTSPKFWLRGLFAAVTRLFGRHFALGLMLPFQKSVPEQYDCAISYLHNEAPNAFYGGANEFVLKRVRAKQKFAFLHCDYEICGADDPGNNKLYEQFNAIAACSMGCRDAFLQVLPHLEKKCYEVRNCTRFAEVRKMAEMKPVEYDRDHLTVVTVARLSRAKGLHRALEAVAYAAGQGVSVEYHIVGDGKTRSFLEVRVKELGMEDRVIFHGEQENPYRYMKNADLFLLASYHEAAPMVIDEAICLGLPVLSVQTTSSDEMILERSAGWVCENEQDALNGLLLRVLRDKEGIEAKKAYLRSISWDNRTALREFSDLLEDGYEYD